MNRLKITALVVSILGLTQFSFSQICLQSDDNYIYDATSNAKSIVKGDFNNDGNLDVIVGNSTGNPASASMQRAVFIKNNGNRSFAAPVPLTSGSQVVDIGKGDFDGDGNLDFVVVNLNLARVAVFFGFGNGTFTAPTSYGSMNFPNALVVADFNGDGSPDIGVVTNLKKLFILINNGAGSFAPQSAVTLPGPGNPYQIAAADFDGDGNIDIATANKSAGVGSVTLLKGDGSGGFTVSSTISTPNGSTDIVAGDFNGDSAPDLAVANEDANNVSVLINNNSSSISFASPVNYSVGSNPTGLRVGNFNGGGLDIAVTNSSDNSMSVLYGTGSGTFSPTKTFHAFNYPESLTIGDFDGDGNQDVMHSCLNRGLMSGFYGDGTGDFDLGNMVDVGNNPRDIAFGDFTGAGNQDFVEVNYADNTASIYANDGLGNFTFNGNLSTGNNPISVVAADLDGDGDKDIMVANYTDGNVSIYNNTGGSFSSPTTVNVNAHPIRIRTGDFNNDNKPDLFVVNEADQVTVLPGNGSGGFGSPITVSTGSQPKDIAVGDLNNDGKDDFVVPLYGANKVEYFTSNGSGFSSATFDQGAGSSSAPIGVALEDFNGDGYPEILVANYGASSFTLCRNNGSGAFAPGAGPNTTYTSLPDDHPMGFAVDDFNGDGNIDVAVLFESSSVSTGSITIYTGDGTYGSGGNPHNLTLDSSFPVGSGPTVIQAAEITGPGSANLAVVNQNSNYVSILVGSPNASFTGLNNTYCASGSPATLVPTTSGGTFSGPGVSGSTFDPSVAGVGGPYTITYTVSDGSCTNHTNQTVTVTAGGADASFTTLNANYCEDDAPITLIPATSGGTFSGEGVSGTTFDPSNVSTLNSQITISYSVTQGGCTGNSSQQVTVNDEPSSDFSGLASDYCENDGSVTLTGTPSGGVFSGTGTSGNSFNPSSAGPGGPYTITYTVTNGACSALETHSTTVHANPSVSITGLNTSYCKDASPVNLVGSPNGGSFTIDGSPATQLDPSSLSAGTHTVKYSLTNGSGCTGTTTQNVTINALPTVSITGLSASYCKDASAVTLSGTPGGGSFTIDGSPATQLDPSSLTATSHTVKYNYTDGSGCTATTTQNVTINALPTPTINGLNSTYCQNGSPVALSGSPTPGSFTIDGTPATQLDPSILSAGNHTVKYSYTDGNGCTGVATQSVSITAGGIDASFTTLNANYCEDDAPVTLVPANSGGTFSGPGVSGSTFDPSNVSTFNSPITISYSVTQGGCTGNSSQQVTVNDEPSAAFSGLASDYCENDGSATLTGTPSGGVFSGTGTSGNSFNPSSAGAGGPYTITYTVTNGACSALETHNTTVHANPSVSITGLNASYCKDASPVNLVGSPNGGSFKIDGSPATQLDPSSLSAGTHTVEYSLTNGSGCTGTTTQNVTINALPTVSITGLSASYCKDASAVTLSGTPGGGSFTIDGTPATQLDPSTLTATSHTVKYSYTDGSGCTGTTTQNVTINALPTVSITGLSASYCKDASAVTLSGTPGGGSFTIDGTPATQLDPSSLTTTSHTVKYSYTDGSGCSATTTQNVTINPLPTVSINGLNSAYCKTDAAVLLSGSPNGGAFKIDGTPATVFDPSSLTATSHTVTYEFVDVNGCSASASQTVTIDNSPSASFTGLSSNYCENNAAVALTGTPAGGTFSGTGISGNNFDPSVAGAGGPYTITYTYTSGACNAIATQNTTVHALPTVSINSLNASYCKNAGVVNLSGYPVGGSFTIDGSAATQLDPSSLSAGTHVVKYSFTDGNGCSNSITQNVTINNLPTVSITGLSSSYCKDANTVTLSGTPGGGSFTIDGTPATQLDPSSLTATSHTVIYSYTDVNGCSNTDSKTIVINALPSVSITNLNASYCKDASPVTLTGTPPGGSFTIDGNATTQLDPSSLTTTSHTVKYSYTDLNGCSASTTQSVTIHAVPTASISGLASNYCETDGVVNLTGTPVGGNFKIDGNPVTQLDPSTLSIGTHIVSYEYTDGNGCSATATQSVTINSKPTAAFSGLATDYCENNSPVTLSGTPSGGTFSGPGTSGNTFNPSSAGAGGPYTITYTVTNGACSTDASHTTTVNALPVVSITNLNASYCKNASPVTLTGTPINGSFTIDGAPATQFDPASLSTSTHVVKYSYTDGNGCTAIATQNVTINAMPTATITGLNTAYCINAGAVTLTATPPGGSFTIDGSSATQLDPSSLTAGSHTVKYDYVDGNGCTATTTQNVMINALPTVAITNLNSSYCKNSSSVTLTATPPGGSFTIDGNPATDLNPPGLSASSHTVKYSYTDGNGCSASTTQNVTINALPTVSITGLASSYCETDGAFALTGTPTTGTFKIDGIVATQFDPSSLTVASHTVTYEYTDGNGCTNTDTKTVTINANPNATITGLNGTYCENANLVTLTGTPSGGSFTINGVTNTIFDPSSLGVGTYTVKYTVSNGACTSIDTKIVEVQALPPTTINGLNADYCVNDPIVNLTGSPNGGTMTIDGSVGTTINPATIGLGSHTVKYTYTDGNGCTAKDVQTVEIHALPTATISGTTVLCEGDPQPAITMTGANGVAPYTFTYKINGGANQTVVSSGNTATINVSTSTPGTFIYQLVSVKDDSPTHCSKSVNGSATVKVNPSPTATLTGSAQVCIGDPYPSIIFTGYDGTSPYVFTYTVNSGGPQMATSTGSTSAITVSTDVQGTFHYHLISVQDNSSTGCSSTVNQTVTIKVHPLPSLVNAGLNLTYCEQASPVTLDGKITPSGGNYTVDGSPATVFDPGALGIGTHTVVYSYTNANGCSADTTISVDVSSQPDASFTGLTSEYCLNNVNIALTPAISGGTFAGAGVSGNQFNPVFAGVGAHTITYTLNNGNGCASNSTQTVVVHPLPDATFNGLPSTMCSDASPVSISVNQGSGTFTGDGMNGNVFNPSVAGVGSHTIVYTIVNQYNCTSFSSQDVDVTASPDASFTPLNSNYCANDTAIHLVATVTPNGIFTGPGVLGSNWNPNLANIGSNTIVYYATDSNGCTSSSTQTINVESVPDASFTGLDSVYCKNDDAVTLNPTNPGGSFAGNGTAFPNQFVPPLAHLGSNIISYSISNGNGCDASSLKLVKVVAPPTSTFTSLDTTLTADATGPGYTYQWINCKTQLSIPGATNPVYHVGQDGEYGLITSVGGCADTSKCILVYFAGLENLSQDQTIQLYPNPNAGTFTLQTSFNAKVDIINSIGQIVYHVQHKKGKHIIQLDPNIETGIYVVRLMDYEGHVAYKKLVIRN